MSDAAEDLVEMHDDAGEPAIVDACEADASRLWARQANGEFRLRSNSLVASPQEEAAYLEFREAAKAVKAANLAAIAASERFRAALQKLSEAAAP